MRSHSIAGLMRLVIGVAVVSAIFRDNDSSEGAILFLLLVCGGVATLYVLVFAALVRCVKESASPPDA
jgi:hypothetical protein